MLESVHFFLYDFLLFFSHWIWSYKEWCFIFNFKCTSIKGHVPISSLRLKMSVNCSTFFRNSSFPFLSSTESLRLSFILSILESVMFLLMSSHSNQEYLSSGVGLFVSSTDNSVHVVIRGISVGCIGFSYPNGVAGVILSWRYWSIGKCFELFVCTRPLDLASKYAISCPYKNSTVLFEVLWTSMQQWLFSNLISIGLRGNVVSNGLRYLSW